VNGAEQEQARDARPLVLLSNDDGYRAAGLGLLREALAQSFEVVVCAPDQEQSASSHSLSLNRPLRLTARAPGVFSVDGTPADSVYVALHAGHVLPRAPDLVVSGMNHGLNLGLDVFYSGTVAAAREGALHGLLALAVSACREAAQEAAAERAAEIARALLRARLAGGRLFNVNFPPGERWPLRATRLGKREYSGGLVARTDPRGLPYYWIGGTEVRHVDAPGSDTEAYDEGVVGVTPLVLDLWSSHLEDDAGRVVAEAERA
jgi:5'-nucleotidase